MQDELFLSFLEEKYKLPVLSNCWEMIKMQMYFKTSYKMNSALRGVDTLVCLFVLIEK